MEDLTGQYADRAVLVPSSMEGGNMTKTADAARGEMTAPGSPGVAPMPAPDQSSQLPQPQLGEVYRPPNRVHGDGSAGEGTWTTVSGGRP
jgi:hypothetical protein